VGAHRLCVLVRADLQKPGACLRRVPTQLHCDLLRLGVEVAPPCFRRVLPHARGGGATAYRLAAVSTDDALRRPAALSSNGLARTCAVATPVATPLLHGSKEAASDFVRNGL
jgi:hypothetical protein